MLVLSRITTHRLRWISRVCLSWDARSPITPTIARKPIPRSLPFPPRLALLKQQRWMLAILAPQHWLPVRIVASSRTLPRVVTPITPLGTSFFHPHLTPHPTPPPPSS